MKKTKYLFFSDLQSTKAEFPQDLKVAVHLHAFYLGLLPDFARYFCNIPVPFSLFISIPDGVKYEEVSIRQIMGVIPQMNSLVIEQTPNRGRDIAPMAVTFGERLKDFDVILHLHTKRSPHNPPQEGWRVYLLEHLLGTRDLVSGILTRLQQNAGIVAAADFLCPSTPDKWGMRENKVFAQQILNRSAHPLDIEKTCPVVDFPQGTMFWCRRDFIEDFFTLGLTYEDFPVEPIGIDGTVAHAMERLFFLWGEHTDYSPIKIYSSQMEPVVQGYYAPEILKWKTMFESMVVKRDKGLRAIRCLIWLSSLLLLTLICAVFCALLY